MASVQLVALDAPARPVGERLAMRPFRRTGSDSRLRHLRYFVSVIDAGSFSRAAEAIHVAQPAISQQIAELERDLGMPLMVRSARGVVPTPEGKALYREAQQILRHVERLSSILSSGQDIEGTVSLGLSAAFAAVLAVPLIRAAQEKFPGIQLQISAADCETIKGRLIAGKLDLACLFEDHPTTRVERLPLFRHRLCYVTKAPSANSTGDVPLRVVASEPLVLPSGTSAMRTLIDRAFAREMIDVTVAVETDHMPTLLMAVRHGLGGTIVPSFGQYCEQELEGLEAPRLLEPALALTSAILWSNDRAMTAAAAAIRDLLTSLFKAKIGEAGAKGIEPLD